MAYRLSGCDGDPGTLFEANFIYIIAKMRYLPDPAGGLTAPPRPPAVLHAASGSVGLGHRGSHSPREKPPTKVLHQAPHIGNPALDQGDIIVPLGSQIAADTHRQSQSATQAIIRLIVYFYAFVSQWVTNKIIKFRSFYYCQRFFWKITFYQKLKWVSGSPPMLYKLVLGPIPIVHTKFWAFPHIFKLFN